MHQYSHFFFKYRFHVIKVTFIIHLLLCLANEKTINDQTNSMKNQNRIKYHRKNNIIKQPTIWTCPTQIDCVLAALTKTGRLHCAGVFGQWVIWRCWFRASISKLPWMDMTKPAQINSTFDHSLVHRAMEMCLALIEIRNAFQWGRDTFLADKDEFWPKMMHEIRMTLYQLHIKSSQF